MAQFDLEEIQKRIDGLKKPEKPRAMSRQERGEAVKKREIKKMKSMLDMGNDDEQRD